MRNVYDYHSGAQGPFKPQVGRDEANDGRRVELATPSPQGGGRWGEGGGLPNPSFNQNTHAPTRVQPNVRPVLLVTSEKSAHVYFSLKNVKTRSVVGLKNASKKVEVDDVCFWI